MVQDGLKAWGEREIEKKIEIDKNGVGERGGGGGGGRRAH